MTLHAGGGMLRTESLMEGAMKMARESIILGEKIAPRSFIHIGGTVFSLPFKDDDGRTEDFLKDKIRTMVRLARKSGRLEGVVLVAEAWLSFRRDDRPPVQTPSRDPWRVEALQVMAWGAEGRDVAFHKIEEFGGKRRLGDKVEMPPTIYFETWLDSAFKDEPGL